MANLKILLFSIFIILSIFTNSISSEEEIKIEKSNENENTIENTGEEKTNNPEEDSEEEEINEDLPEGNLLDSKENSEALKSLNLDQKEFLTKDELKTLYEKTILRSELSPDETSYFQKMIDNIITDLPEKIEKSQIRNYFEMSFLIEYLKKISSPILDEDKENEKNKDEI